MEQTGLRYRLYMYVSLIVITDKFKVTFERLISNDQRLTKIAKLKLFSANFQLNACF